MFFKWWLGVCLFWRLIMYHYVEDKKLVSLMKVKCFGLVNELVQEINKDGFLKTTFELVGSGARNLITQNGSEPVDLDFNLIVLDSECDINDGMKIKEFVRQKFDLILKRHNEKNCKDSTSALTTSLMCLRGISTFKFSIDLAIVCYGDSTCYRLIHKKTGYVDNDEWIWNESQHSDNLFKKVEFLKNNRLWNDVRKIYLEKKNLYLRRNNYDHPSFNCYIEAVNEVYNYYK